MISLIVGVTLIYLLINIVLAAKAHKQSSNTFDDYFLASSSVHWLSLSITIFATWISTFAFLGATGFYYSVGMNWLIAHGFFLVGSPLLIWIIGRRIWVLRQLYGYSTPGELLAGEFGCKKVSILIALVSLVALIPYSLIQLVGIGKAIETATNGVIKYELAVIFSGLGIAIYAFIGGVRAIIWTDVVQAGVFAFVMVAGVVICIYLAGGFEQGFNYALENKPNNFVLNQSNFGSPLSTMIIWGVGFVLMPHMWQRIFMASDEKTLGKSIIGASVLAYVIVAIPSVIIGTMAISFLPSLSDSDRLMPTIFNEFVPILLPFLVLGAFAAGMSTIDSQLMSASSMLIRDVVEPIMGNRLSNQKQREIGRWLVLISIVFLTLLALSSFSQSESIVTLAGKGVAIIFLLFVPTCAVLFLKEANAWAGMTSLIMGIFFLAFVEFEIFSFPIPYGFSAIIITSILQFIVFLVMQCVIGRVSLRTDLDL